MFAFRFTVNFDHSKQEFYHFTTEKTCRKMMMKKILDFSEYNEPKPQYRGKGKKKNDLLIGWDENGYELCRAEYIGKTEI